LLAQWFEGPTPPATGNNVEAGVNFLTPTAAMMAGLTDSLWSFENLYDEAMAA
jgi:hypothetical protein